MPYFTRAALAAALGLIVAMPAWAAERSALLLMQRDYRHIEDVDETPGVREVSRDLRAAQFRVTARGDGDERALLSSLGSFLEGLDEEAEAVVIFLSGHFVTTERETYLLTRDIRTPADLPGLMQHALPMSVVLAVLEDHPGRAALVLGHSGKTGEAGPRARFGIGGMNAPSDVIIAQGAPVNAAAFVSETLLRPGRSLVRGARQHSVTFRGDAPERGMSFLGGGDGRSDTLSETVLWQRAQQADTIAAYRRYLQAHPQGRNADTARRMIREIQNEPNRAARRAEEALNLDRDARRAIQRNLSILGYNTRGIDGIFGRGTRGAIEAWQRRNDFDVTSYLTGNQVARLAEQARARAAELEEEARRKQAEEERRDRAYWDETGAFEDESGYRAYLERYPDGLFSEQAKTALARIEERRRNRAERRDQRRWQRAEEVGTVTAYREYLRDFPEGAFREEAQRRINALTRDPEEEAAERRAKAAEDALRLDVGTRRLIEARLRQLQLNPGNVDGTFDAKTRRAIRNYQKARGLRVTGYVDQGTAVRMLADVFR